MRFNLLLLPACAVIWVAPGWLCAQDPGAAQDALIERQKILKAADQIDLLEQQNGSLQQDVAQMKERLRKLEDENVALKKAVADNEQARLHDREVLLKDVSRIVATSSKGEKPRPAPEKEATGTTTGRQEGIEHVVEPGETVWAIAKACRDSGLKVTSEDILKANNLTKNDSLKVGQKLFIPKL